MDLPRQFVEFQLTVQIALHELENGGQIRTPPSGRMRWRFLQYKQYPENVAENMRNKEHIPKRLTFGQNTEALLKECAQPNSLPGSGQKKVSTLT